MNPRVYSSRASLARRCFFFSVPLSLSLSRCHSFAQLAFVLRRRVSFRSLGISHLCKRQRCSAALSLPLFSSLSRSPSLLRSFAFLLCTHFRILRQAKTSLNDVTTTRTRTCALSESALSYVSLFANSTVNC